MTVAVDGIAGIEPRKCRSAVLHSYGEGNEDAAAIAELFAWSLRASEPADEILSEVEGPLSGKLF
jgi:hypothetical protein